MAILAECPKCHTKQATKNKKCIGWLDKKAGHKCKQNLDIAKKVKTIRYWIVYRRKADGKQRWESVGAFEGLKAWSITDAKDALSKRTVQKIEKPLFDIEPDSNITFAELIEWFLDLDKIRKKAYYKTLNSNLKHFKDAFGDMLAGRLKPNDLEGFQVRMQEADYSDSYIDSILEAAKNVIYKAFDNDLIGGEPLKPFRKVKKLTKRGDNARTRILSHDEFKQIRDNLPVHSQPIFVMGYYTGMREGEILNLTWDRVDMGSRLIQLTKDMTKERRAKTVPISKTLRSVLMQLPDRGKEGHVFTYADKPIKDIRDGLKRACENVDIVYGRFKEGGFIFHDLRRTFVTNARKAGVARNVTMKITGHSDRGNMNARYDQIDASDLIKAVDLIESYLQSVSQNVSQVKNTLSK
jgi:integrase